MLRSRYGGFHRNSYCQQIQGRSTTFLFLFANIMASWKLICILTVVEATQYGMHIIVDGNGMLFIYY